MSSQSPYPWQSGYWSELTDSHKHEQLAHAYLIYGPKGIGKFDFIRKFSKYLLCHSPVNNLACEKCDDCLLGVNSTHPDYIQISPENESRVIKIEQIRSLSSFLNKTSHSGRAKVAVLDGAHLLNTAAANALLKTLEEPSKKTFIFLCSHLPGSLTLTVRSRCHKLAMKAPSRDMTIEWLKDNINSHSDFNSLAKASSNKPLYALHLFETGTLAQETEFIGKFLELTRGDMSLRSMVDLIGEIGAATAIGFLAKFFNRSTKFLLLADLKQGMSPEENEFVALCRISNFPLKNTVLILITFYDELIIAQRQLLDTNLNAELIVESLVWEWSKLNSRIIGDTTR